LKLKKEILRKFIKVKKGEIRLLCGFQSEYLFVPVLLVTNSNNNHNGRGGRGQWSVLLHEGNKWKESFVILAQILLFFVKAND
jgi:hypothetical protein